MVVVVLVFLIGHGGAAGICVRFDFFYFFFLESKEQHPLHKKNQSLQKKSNETKLINTLIIKIRTYIPSSGSKALTHSWG